ncbi:hypothetical protein BV898_18245 [Hypsibius exemplaris]|uniref:Uncharacterized protein n=1 Tax=Hypsibius exemplaris TaxID=2072580 RepID=A0A9X6RMX9_HYPEX|nr:hypothetical protein BV898_18245 [Hypsibius exemplaris]
MAFALLALSLAAVVGQALAVLPDGYVQMKAAQKQKIIGDQILASQYKTLPNGSTMSGWDFRDRSASPRCPLVQEVFWGTSDELAEGRDKIISPYGVAATCELKIFPNSPYTGFTKAADFKVFIDGQRSQNIHVGVNVEGQIAGNETRFFKDTLPSGYDVTVPPNSPDFIKALAVGLQESIDTLSCDPGTSAAECKLLRPVNIGTLGQVEQASVDRNGYNASKIYAPYLVRLVPNAELVPLDQGTVNYRAELVRTLKADYRMFDVETKRSSCDDWIKIGELWSRSVFTAGKLRGSEASSSAVPSPVVPRVHCAPAGSATVPLVS